MGAIVGTIGVGMMMEMVMEMGLRRSGGRGGGGRIGVMGLVIVMMIIVVTMIMMMGARGLGERGKRGRELGDGGGRWGGSWGGRCFCIGMWGIWRGGLRRRLEVENLGAALQVGTALPRITMSFKCSDSQQHQRLTSRALQQRP